MRKAANTQNLLSLVSTLLPCQSRQREVVMLKQPEEVKKKKERKKWAVDLNKHFFQRKHTDSQEAQEKMLNIVNHQGNENANGNEISPHSCQNH